MHGMIEISTMSPAYSLKPHVILVSQFYSTADPFRSIALDGGHLIDSFLFLGLFWNSFPCCYVVQPYMYGYTTFSREFFYP